MRSHDAVRTGLMVTALATALAGRGEPAQAPSEAGASASAPHPAHSATSATCPPHWSGEAPTNVHSDGVLVRPGSIDALLCTYESGAPQGTPLSARHNTDHTEEIADYLNGLAAARPEGEACLLGSPVEHAIVFVYPDDRSMVIYARNCAWDQGTIVRYGGDIRKITGYWGVAWNKP